jgi:hypothetical protein
MQMTDQDIDRLAELLNIAPEIASRILSWQTRASDQTLGRCHGELHAAEYDPSRTADRRLLKLALDAILSERDAAYLERDEECRERLA